MIKEEIFYFFFKSLRKVNAKALSTGKKVENVAFIFRSILDETVKSERLHFTTTFAKYSFIAQKYQFSKQLNFFANHFRIQSRQITSDTSPEKLETIYRVGVVTCLRMLEGVSGIQLGQEEKDNLPYAFPSIKRTAKKTVQFIPTARVILTSNLPKQKQFTGLDVNDPDNPISIQYQIPDRNEHFNNTVILINKVFQFPVNVQLLDVDVDESGTYLPKGIVIEPDFLVDVSAVAASFSRKGNMPLWYMVNKFLPYEYTQPIMLGNIANFFLDELTSNPDQAYPDLFPKVFLQYPLVFSMWDDSTVRSIYKSAQRHFLSILKVLKKDFAKVNIQFNDAVLEPSFFSNQYGIQGRLDLFYESKDANNTIAIVELKSGSPWQANRYGISQSHYIQTLLYDLLIRSFSKSANPANYILYSKLDVDQLKFAPRVKAIQYDAIQARNELVAIEKALMDINQHPLGDHSVLEYVRPEQFDQYKGFTFQGFETFFKVFQELDRIETKYVKSFISFIARENWLAKVGDASINARLGQAKLWMSTLQEKEDDFSILRGLKMVGMDFSERFPVIAFRKTETTNELANFRVGDIAILHPEKEGNANILQSRIIKSSIIFLDEKEVHIQLRSYQVNQKDFDDRDTWVLEPDFYERSFAGQYQALFKWAKSDKKHRELTLSLRPPRLGRMLSLPAAPGMTDEQSVILAKMLSTKEYFLLWGPPGTGKTSVILKSAVQYLAKSTTEKVLLIAYTNRAVDEICAAIESGDASMRDLYFRIGNPNSTHHDYKPQLLSEKIKNSRSRKEVKSIIAGHRIVVSTVASIANKDELFQLIEFDTLIVDEASQILEPQLVGVLQQVGRFILVGDHRQLPAVVSQSTVFSQVSDPDFDKIGLVDMRNSLFERLFFQCKKNDWHWAYGMLSKQGRMHQEVMAFANQHFYDGQLSVLPEGFHPVQKEAHYLKYTAGSRLQKQLCQARMIFLNSSIDIDAASGKKNIHEAHLVLQLLQEIAQMYRQNGLELSKESVGVITPYRAQIALIRELVFKQLPEWKDILTIDTVERYQGGARDIVIISTCVNRLSQLDNLVALSDEGIDRKLNVALTRARSQIIMIGSKQLLSIDPRYGAFVKKYLFLDVP